MSIPIEELYQIGQYLNIYLGSLMFIAGLIGSIMNIWLFTRLCFEKSPCAKYILISSVFDIIHLISALLLRILADGFNFDPASSSTIICRIRYYLVTSSAYISVGCRCLAAFDRYACTSRSRSLRTCSSLKFAYRFLIVNVFCWLCFACPNFVYFDLKLINQTKLICTIINLNYSNYFAYFVNPILYFALPIIFLLTFAFKTQTNLKLMNRTRRLQKLERQMSSMIILQALTNSISSIPYGIQFFYSALTHYQSKTPYRHAQEHLFLQITRLCYYINFISAFYIYLISSKQIRTMIKSIKSANSKETISLLDISKSQTSDKLNPQTNSNEFHL